MGEVAQRVQSLPAELYDKIYKEVFTFVISTENKTHKNYTTDIANKNYKPPACLHVDRCSRTLFAQAYYANTVFITSPETIHLWLRSIPSEHSEMLKEVQCIDQYLLHCPPEYLWAMKRTGYRMSNKDIAYGTGKHLMRNVEGELAFTYRVGADHGKHGEHVEQDEHGAGMENDANNEIEYSKEKENNEGDEADEGGEDGEADDCSLLDGVIRWKVYYRTETGMEDFIFFGGS